MATPIIITQGGIYIFRGVKATSRNEFYKFKILEVTQFTYLIKNIDTGCTFRQGIEGFNHNREPVEDLTAIEQGDLNSKDLI